ncbi:sulfur oxidation c-type cytochrome SoxX [Falsiroseomonas sp.]|uniref:sulfur oxidation c-type cytochrome SoxX n=1 Tax=Falsiroseomonas sp. TaxID=2870721 RepID=UPI00271EF1BC|nr:sulfur oxidation c-type cytochrome SoxX [Falsiroseomonas sp.]MDO9502747.1 sulfur oxidation c-type cytochrome SoxX [Falsiroseomonas sp.]
MTARPDPFPTGGGGAGWACRLGLGLMLLLPGGPGVAQVAPHSVTGDAIEAPLDGLAGDAARGAAVTRNRATANCLICHSIPDTREQFMGDIGPPLAGVGSRLSQGQIRLRLVDPTRLNPGAVMPPYHRIAGLTRVDERYRGQPVLTAQEIEDVVAFLATLKDREE